MFRFLFKWSLQITGASMVGYNYMGPQKQADLEGATRSIVNSSRASFILFRSVYDYYYELQGIEYNSQQYHVKRSQIHSRVANRILELSKTNKGIYLKLGQYLGNLDKVMPWEFTEVLKILQDSGPSIPYENIKTVITEDLQVQPRQIFDTFNKNAFAAASLAQVHKATLKENNKQVAVKIQFPFLRNQSRWDLWVMKHITQFCNYLMLRNNYKQIDLIKIFDTWTQSLIEQLDFERQIANAERTRKLFKDNVHLHIPKIYPEYSSERMIVMQYIDGIKITEKEQLAAAGYDTPKIAKKLVSVFAEMIFKYGFVHCDAHPGNILIRKHPRGTDPKLHYQIVLLDHGLYRSLTPEFINNFSYLWVSLVKSDKKNVLHYAQKLNIEKHLQYLPIVFLFRTVSSRKKIGQAITKQQKHYFREKDIANFESVNNILQDLPPDLMFIIKATNLIASHNLKLGGTQRDRIIKFTQLCLWNMSGQSKFWYSINLFGLSIRIWLFQHFYGIYKTIFGTLA